ncbi:putative beta-lysine N-acetyltransferase [Paenibacillus sp. OV219]|uniref:putative beta-lysine N-acetyltransferase n=1 Tax=Paenibacillus sp. OV219 TaxID=1884377 RepID=UPI0008D11B62|nr:putative beta-lysine N-acetyltransferase [Paenibacillus sp. OV219]SEO95813.1 beta-lysine acetyltransferase [Paenibacillus sp. OV219]
MSKEPNTNRYYSVVTENGDEGLSLQLFLDYFNKRLRIDDYTGEADLVCRRAAEVAQEQAFTKIFIKARSDDWMAFLTHGYMLEGIFKGYFHGCDAYSMACYTDLERRTSDYWMEEDQILRQVLALEKKLERDTVPASFVLRPAVGTDADELAALYGQVFQTYPTPMNDPAYIRHVMDEGTVFFVVVDDGKLISASSAEINSVYHNAEITDCVTLPAYRGKGFMRLLIQSLEEDLRKRNILALYSLSRALSFGMNAALFQLGYEYTGRLTKNCDIYDKFEDMNMWCKQLTVSGE